jgi:hypothetical protein
MRVPGRVAAALQSALWSFEDFEDGLGDADSFEMAVTVTKPVAVTSDPV